MVARRNYLDSVPVQLLRIVPRGNRAGRRDDPAAVDPRDLSDGRHRDERAPGREHHVVTRRAQAGDGVAHVLRQLLVVRHEGAVDVERDEHRPGRVVRDEGTRHATTGSSTSRPPRYGRRPSGTRTEPSACWWFSRIATIQRVVPSVPLSVATVRVSFLPSTSTRSRTLRRRAWNVVQFDVDVSSR